ncbi:MAG: hypothetical protein WCY32_11465 [Burkholderiaceae bacterium]
MNLLDASSGPFVATFLLLMLLIGVGYTRRRTSIGLFMLWAGVLAMLGMIVSQILRALSG